MEIFCKIGDTIGYIRKFMSYGETAWKWELVETNVDWLSVHNDGVRVHTKRFSRLYDDEIRGNTEMLRKNSQLIIVQEPFVMDDKIRERVTLWVDGMNENSTEREVPNEDKT